MFSALEHLSLFFGPFRLFGYVTVRILLAAATAFIFGVLAGPWFIRRLSSMKQSFRSAKEVGKLADLHARKGGTPTMGGLIIFSGVWLAALLWTRANRYVWLTLIVYTGLTAIGFLDDYLKISKKNSKGLPSIWKLFAQGLLTVIVIGVLAFSSGSMLHVTELWIPFVKMPVELPLWAMAIFFFIVLAGTSNAINLTDGVDGLAIGCTVSNALVFAIMSYAAGHAAIADYLLISHVPGTGELAVLLGALLGGSLAFLWYNAYPASIFMGDTGSLAIGGLLGTVAFLIHQPFVLVIVGGVFVMEACSVLLQMIYFKVTGGKRLFKMAPIHHHFELGGWAETKVVVRFWIISLLFALIGLATLKLR
jgi:phospho-N-acetylmuramoyl-pentapeptide-transferase